MLHVTRIKGQRHLLTLVLGRWITDCLCRPLTCILADLDKDASGRTNVTSTCWGVADTCVEGGGAAVWGEGGRGGGCAEDRSYKGGRPRLRFTNTLDCGVSSCLRLTAMMPGVAGGGVSDCFSTVSADLHNRETVTTTIMSLPHRSSPATTDTE